MSNKAPEDEALMLMFLAMIVSQQNDAEQAINYISDNDIQLQILDIRINGETGIDVWLSMRKKHFDIPTIFISGYTKQFFDQINEISQISQIEIMEKPFTPHELLNKIKDLALARF